MKILVIKAPSMTLLHLSYKNQSYFKPFIHCFSVLDPSLRKKIDSAVADGAQAVILPQVTFGIAVRMAVMSMLAGA